MVHGLDGLVVIGAQGRRAQRIIYGLGMLGSGTLSRFYWFALRNLV